MDILEDFQWRGAINQCTDLEGLRKLLKNKKVSLYCGTDPTGDSLHIGHLIPFIMLKRFQLAGHHPYILIGGGTGFIGDPSGRKTERSLQTTSQVEHNEKALTSQMVKLFGTENFDIVNNYDWLSKIDLLSFLRDYGKSFNVNTMLSKEAVASRLDNGISFTEFSYQILQSIDFYHLLKEKDIQLQIGGADQWGNLANGVDLIHKKDSKAEAYGLTIPLMLKADGTKFGKTAGGAVWLDPKKTSPFEFYQFWFNQDDRDVVKYLKYFTFLSHDEINALEEKVTREPEKREAQKRLAQEVTSFVHGVKEMKEAEKISEVLFSGDIKQLSASEIKQAFDKVPSAHANNLLTNIVDLLVNTEIEPSKRQAREDVTNGAITINGERVTDVESMIDPKDGFDGKYIVARKGKKNYTLISVEDAN
ncbi:tyrosine--tRNA ligase [Companilactobacillus halodurans]|uniref:Tyrosine--tRNA ligase n=1 Tax=Companilactobacillus halodurans TaxID=2584183 RepID=A0A5P0ZYC1_9LACO|nr:tyrosine--tRNA ligase [Companilactobacillus halodurans]MQS98093.1 tyrosine--tRNA ligase [Companilactobacillus halodurans]